MADVSTVYQRAQVGVESTPGTGVAVTKYLQSFSIKPGIKADVKKFRPLGNKFITAAALSKEWTEAPLEGILDYNEIVYLLCSVMQKVSPTGASTDKTWTFGITPSANDTVQTYTTEFGYSERAQKFSYGLVTGLKLDFSRAEGVSLSGSMIGQALQDDVTYTTSGVTAITQVPVLGTHLSAYLADTAAGLTSATALTRAFSASLELGDRYKPIFPMNRSVSGFDGHVETAPAASMKLKLEADDNGMIPLVNLRAGSTKFIRIEAQGPQISTGIYYKFTLDMAGKVGQPDQAEDEDGVYAITWPFDICYDATWGKAVQIAVVNTVSAL